MSAEAKLIKTPYYGFLPKTGNFDFGKKQQMMPLERTPKEEQNGANFSF